MARRTLNKSTLNNWLEPGRPDLLAPFQIVLCIEYGFNRTVRSVTLKPTIMPGYYKKAIYQELGDDIGKELKKNRCEIVINYEDLTYNFSDCPDSLLEKIIKVKKSKGENSVLNEFRPDGAVAHLKWNMSEMDRKSLIKRFHGFETTLDHLTFERRITCEQLRKDL
jgi:hypothetical protein